MFALATRRRRLFALLLPALLLLLAGLTFRPALSANQGATPFLDVTDSAGIQWPHYKLKDYHAPGQAWGDYNGDGWDDLYITGQLTGTNMLFDNNGDGTFSQSPYSSTVALAEPSGGASFADYDNDGDPDLYVGNYGANVLFRNDGNGFTDVTAAAGVGDLGKTSTASWGDYDNDGRLDLYVANWWHDDCKVTDTFDCPQNSDRLYHNNGDGSFTDITSSLNQQYITATLGLGFVASFVDYDNDNDLDIYLVNDQFTPEFGNTNHNHLWRNDGSPAEGGCGDPNWCWTEVSESTGTDYLLCGMGLAIGDYDKDGDLDFYFSNAGFCGEGGTHHLLQNQTSQGSPTFVDVTASAGVGFDQVGWGTIFIDYDYDTWQDLYVASGNAENPLYKNNGDGTFTDVTASSGANDAGPSRGVAYADYNNDGWVDMVTSNRDGGEIGHHLYMNQSYTTSPNNHYLKVRLQGDGVKVNRDAVGARVYLTIGDGQIHMQEVKNGSSLGAGNSRDLFFGLGEIGLPAVQSVRVEWPDGTVEKLRNVDYDQLLTVQYGQTLPAFSEKAQEMNLTFSHELSAVCTPPIGAGSAWADYDNDGLVDLFVTNHGGANQLYHNLGDMNSDGLPDFNDVAGALGLQDSAAASHGAVFIDYDNDGDQDLYVTAWEETKLYQNQLSQSGTASFVDVTAAAGIGDDGRPVTAGWADFDQDGYLDLYIAKHKHCSADDPPLSQDHLFHNNGDGTFADVTSWLCGGPSTCAQVEGLGFTPGWVDYDNDGDLDLYVVNDNITQSFYHNVLWRNDGPDGSGGWLFTDVSAASGADSSVNGMGLGVGDYNNDGWFDLAFSNIGANNLLLNNGNGTFSDVSAAAGIQRATLPGTGNDSITWGTAFFDYDNNGLLDLYYVAGWINLLNDPVQPNAFFTNNGDGTFTDYSVESGLDDPSRGRALSLADVDRDGYVDLFVGNYGETPLFYHNNAAAGNHWLAVTVEGTVSNRDGIGTRLWLTTADGTQQMRAISSGPSHGGGDQRLAAFGLGQAVTGTLQVRWPSGVMQDLGVVDADQYLHLVEPSPDELVYVSSSTGGTVQGISFAREDILGYASALDVWYMVFDGSDVGVTTDVNAFTFLDDGSLLFSLRDPATLPDVGAVDDSDVVQFLPSSLGANTAGTFSLFFDGAAHDLASDGEDIDALALAPDGRLLLSTVGNWDVTTLSGNDEDVIAYDMNAGTWAGYVDGSDVGLNTTSFEDVIGTWVDPDNGDIYLTTKGAFGVDLLNGGGADIFVCQNPTTGSNTACTFSAFWRGADHGFGDEIVDGIALGKSAGNLLFAGTAGGSVAGLSVTAQDVLGYDRALSIWFMLLDGSDLGLTKAIDGLDVLPGGEMLLSLVAPQPLGTLGWVDDSDVLRFAPSALGWNSAGSFSLALDGSTAGLESNSEDVDAVALAPDGRIVISTVGNWNVPGQFGNVSGKDEDLIAYDAGSGVWGAYFDGSDVGLTDPSEDIVAAWIDAASGDIYLSTQGAFTVTGASGDGSDVFVCTPGSIGNNTSCTFSSFLDGSATGLNVALTGVALWQP